jgi:hypothetical protein
MGAPSSGMKAGEQPAAETLLTAFKTIDAKERRRHASVLNYWLSIRGDKEFPPLHDLDPLELSDAGPNSALLELLSGGHDAEIRHLGEAIRGDEDWPDQIMDAPNPSILACIAKKLPIVAISRDFLAFEDEFTSDEGKTRCWVTLLPLSAGGAWVDYVYALVSFDVEGAKPAKAKKKAAEPEPEPEMVEEPFAEEVQEPESEMAEESVADEPEEAVAEAPEPPTDEAEALFEEPVAEVQDEEPAASAVAKATPGFSKLLDSIAGLTGFYGSQPVKVEPVVEDAAEPVEEPVADEPAAAEPIAEESVADEPVVEEAPVEEPVADEPPADQNPVEEPVADEPSADQKPVEEPLVAEEPVSKTAEKSARASEGSLQSKLTDVRAKTNDARLAQIRANAALYEGLSAAYDFALDAEDTPEEYLKMVEAQGLKIQLRSPMKPVVKLAFDGMCDDATIKQLEAVLAWAIDQELPRGSLAERIDEAGGISQVLSSKAA